MNKDLKKSRDDLQDQKLQRDAFHHQKSSSETEDRFSEIASPWILGIGNAVQPWSQLWSQTWIFHWRIGVLIVNFRASQYQPSVRPESFGAFENSNVTLTRYLYVMSVDFRPASNFRIARGVSIRCSTKQDQRGSYQICPMISTFAYESEVFICVARRDLAGLKYLFSTGQATPTDRTERMDSPLHVSPFLMGRSKDSRLNPTDSFSPRLQRDLQLPFIARS